MIAKSRAEEAIRETETVRRKVLIAREDGRIEAQGEIETLKQQLRDSEEKYKDSSNELRRVSLLSYLILLMDNTFFFNLNVLSLVASGRACCCSRSIGDGPAR